MATHTKTIPGQPTFRSCLVTLTIPSIDPPFFRLPSSPTSTGILVGPSLQQHAVLCITLRPLYACIRAHKLPRGPPSADSKRRSEAQYAETSLFCSDWRFAQSFRRINLKRARRDAITIATPGVTRRRECFFKRLLNLCETH